MLLTMPSASPSSAEQVSVIDDARSRVAREATDRTGSCWRIYRDELYRADETFETAFTETARGALAVNFYHHRHQGHYSDQHLAAFEGIASLEARLALHEPGLTPRELAVCARRLIGMLYEGIATDLGISLASVKTYRKRAFERLDIHFRNELYDIAIGLGRS